MITLEHGQIWRDKLSPTTRVVIAFGDGVVVCKETVRRRGVDRVRTIRPYATQWEKWASHAQLEGA